jgi:hypothetical protein
MEYQVVRPDVVVRVRLHLEIAQRGPGFMVAIVLSGGDYGEWAWSRWRQSGSTAGKSGCDTPEPSQRSFQAFGDLGGDFVRRRQAVRILLAGVL